MERERKREAGEEKENVANKRGVRSPAASGTAHGVIPKPQCPGRERSLPASCRQERLCSELRSPCLQRCSKTFNLEPGQRQRPSFH